jgi:hypothetical protein
VPAKQSHTGKNLLIASHEVSGTTTIFQIDDLFPTNIEKQASINNISIFPNPSQSNITITVQNFATTSKIKIVNSFGQLMHQQEMKEKSIQLPIMHLANGVYNVIISDETNDANIQTSTFVKY